MPYVNIRLSFQFLNLIFVFYDESFFLILFLWEENMYLSYSMYDIIRSMSGDEFQILGYFQPNWRVLSSPGIRWKNFAKALGGFIKLTLNYR